MEKEQYVILPKKDEGPQLKGYEILVYVSIRRYINKDTLKAHPSMEVICDKSGLSRPTVSSLIKKIAAKGYFTVSKIRTNVGTVNLYTFSNEKSFEPFSYEFLDNKELTKEEKLNILCTQQYMYKNDGIGKVSYSDAELSRLTGLDRGFIKKSRNSLIEKGFCTQVTLKGKDSETGLRKNETIYHLDELGQAVVFALRVHEERLNQHEKDMKIMMEEIARLKEQLSQKKEIIL